MDSKTFTIISLAGYMHELKKRTVSFAEFETWFNLMLEDFSNKFQIDFSDLQSKYNQYFILSNDGIALNPNVEFESLTQLINLGDLGTFESIMNAYDEFIDLSSQSTQL